MNSESGRKSRWSDALLIRRRREQQQGTSSGATAEASERPRPSWGGVAAALQLILRGSGSGAFYLGACEIADRSVRLRISGARDRTIGRTHPVLGASDMEESENGARRLPVILTTVLILLGVWGLLGGGNAREELAQVGYVIAAALSFGFALIGNRS